MFKKECCKQCRHAKFKGTMANWPVHKKTHTEQHKTRSFNVYSADTCLIPIESFQKKNKILTKSDVETDEFRPNVRDYLFKYVSITP